MIVHKVWFTPLGPSTCMGVPVLLVYVCTYVYCVYMYPAYYTLSSLVPTACGGSWMQHVGHGAD